MLMSEEKALRFKMKRSMSELYRFSFKLSLLHNRYFAEKDEASKKDARIAWLLLDK